MSSGTNFSCCVYCSAININLSDLFSIPSSWNQLSQLTRRLKPFLSVILIHRRELLFFCTLFLKVKYTTPSLSIMIIWSRLFTTQHVFLIIINKPLRGLESWFMSSIQSCSYSVLASLSSSNDCFLSVSRPATLTPPVENSLPTVCGIITEQTS